MAVVKCHLSDLEALREAVEALGQRLQEGGRVRFWGGLSEPCDWVVPLPGRYDVGFRQEGQTFVVVADSEVLSPRGSQLAREAVGILGPGLKRLYQEYAYHKLARDQAILGRTVTRETLPDGRLQVRIAGF